MNDNNPIVAAAREMYSAIAVDDTWQNAIAFQGREPLWLDQLVSSILLGLGGEEPSYVALGGAHDGQAEVLRIAVFTANYLALGSARGQRGTENWTWNVTVRGLKGLRTLDVKASVGLFRESSSARYSGLAWPGTPQATLHFEDGLEVTIPFVAPQNHIQRERLVATVMGLARYLA